jgi:hypothetical protein
MTEWWVQHFTEEKCQRDQKVIDELKKNNKKTHLSDGFYFVIQI